MSTPTFAKGDAVRVVDAPHGYRNFIDRPGGTVVRTFPVKGFGLKVVITWPDYPWHYETFAHNVAKVDE